MKRRIFILFILLATFTVTSGCTDKRPKYKNLAFEFMIYYTPGWEVQEKVGSAIVAFLRPRASKLDFFQEVLTITVDDLTQPVNLSQYSNAVIEQVRAIGKTKDVQVGIIESAPIKISGKPGQKLVYTMTQYGNPPELIAKGLAPKIDAQGTTVKMMLAWTMKEQKAYLFTYVALKDEYETHLKDVEAMIQSFRFL